MYHTMQSLHFVYHTPPRNVVFRAVAAFTGLALAIYSAQLHRKTKKLDSVWYTKGVATWRCIIPRGVAMLCIAVSVPEELVPAAYPSCSLRICSFCLPFMFQKNLFLLLSFMFHKNVFLLPTIHVLEESVPATYHSCSRRTGSWHQRVSCAWRWGPSGAACRARSAWDWNKFRPKFSYV